MKVLPKRLADEAESHGVLPQDLALLDGFARAGEIVLLLGDQAELALRAYARCVAGGEIRSHALDPSSIGLDDLWRVPGTGRPTAFALAWHRAQVSPETTVLLCLRDLDAAPFRLWLASLHSVMQAPDRPRNLLLLSTSFGLSGGDEEEQPGTEQLRHHLVALMPGLHPESGSADVAFDGQLSEATVLEYAAHDGETKPSPAALAQISKRGKEARVVRRAIRVGLVVGEGTSLVSQSVPIAWAGYLLDGRTQDLPQSLTAGHNRLKTLHLQR